MKNKTISIDKLKILFAIFIIAVHTYPLTSISENADFIFTHVFCRIGVPFFLMVTGYFVLQKALQDKSVLIKYTKKIILIYAISTIIYIPVNIYAGKFDGIGFIGILKAIFIDGTFYHLWYFPALILGIWITYFIAKKLKGKMPIIICMILYLIGLFGDSYYGITSSFEITKNIYNVIFKIFEYTRNGLFYVPIFIYMGYMLKEKQLNIGTKQNVILIVFSTILMIIEGLILRQFDLQRHDSMYIMLIPLMFVLFNLIVQKQDKTANNKKLRELSTTIYIMHPLFIIVVRGIAKIVHLQDLMIDNSVIHYLLVVISTIIFSIFFEFIKEKIKDGRNSKRQSLDRA